MEFTAGECHFVIDRYVGCVRVANVWTGKDLESRQDKFRNENDKRVFAGVRSGAREERWKLVEVWRPS